MLNLKLAKITTTLFVFFFSFCAKKKIIFCQQGIQKLGHAAVTGLIQWMEVWHGQTIHRPIYVQSGVWNTDRSFSMGFPC